MVFEVVCFDVQLRPVFRAVAKFPCEGIILGSYGIFMESQLPRLHVRSFNYGS